MISLASGLLDLSDTSQTLPTTSKVKKRMVSLVSLPEDVKLQLLEHLDVADARNLSIVHSSWTIPARSVIFRRIETVKPSNMALGHLVESVLPSIAKERVQIKLELN